MLTHALDRSLKTSLKALPFVPVALVLGCNFGPPPGQIDDDDGDGCQRRYHCVDRGDFVECEDGYTWEDPTDQDNLRCKPKPVVGEGEGEGEGPPPPPIGEGEGEGEGEGPPPPPPPDDPPPTCSSQGAVSGTLLTSISNLSADSASTAIVGVEHRLDVDPGEDRCITEYEIDAQLHSLGCHLILRFETDSDGIGALREITFEADSFCAGFSDAQEGTYYAYGDAPMWPNGDPGFVPDYQSPSSCITGVNLTFPNQDLTLRHDYNGDSLTINLGSLAIYGSYTSSGYAVQGGGRTCRESVGCGVDEHDGGDGFCTDLGYCNEGFTIQYPELTCGVCGASDTYVSGMCVNESAMPSSDIHYMTSDVATSVQLDPTKLKLLKLNVTAGDYVSGRVESCSNNDIYRVVVIGPDGETMYEDSYDYCDYSNNYGTAATSGEVKVFLAPYYADTVMDTSVTLTATPGS
jgi:hypothetical protein